VLELMGAGDQRGVDAGLRAEWVQRWTYPNLIVESGQRLAFDGVTYSVLDLGPGGDSDANSVWFVESPRRTAFLGDLVFNGTHSYVADGHLLAWLANLARVERRCEGMDLVFPGHGAPDAPGRLLAKQRDYLLTLASHVKELAGGKPALSDAAKKELEERMTAAYPGAGLAFLIGMSADPIARELAGPVEPGVTGGFPAEQEGDTRHEPERPQPRLAEEEASGDRHRQPIGLQHHRMALRLLVVGADPFVLRPHREGIRGRDLQPGRGEVRGRCPE
jgi:hypothetical protein